MSGMTGLSRSFYEVACQLTQAMSRGDAVTLVKYPPAVVMLNVACLESYLNEFLSVKRQLEAATWEAPIAALDNESIETRWIEAPRLFGPTFDTGRRPFQSFHKLICLRNALVHYQPRFRKTTEFPSSQIESLQQEFPFTHKGTADWTSQVLNLNCSRWACKTTKAMVRGFHELVGGNDESSYPYPWPDPE